MADVKVGKESEVRQSYWNNYWMENSSHHTIEGMMFDTKAAQLDKEDRPEVLSILPSYEGKSVLELGAGIGRFTADFAEKAGHLVTMDLIESLIKKNEAINGHYKNVEFVCADVVSPDFNFPAESFDLIFSSWLLLYLSDEEVKALAQRMLKWLKVGGHFFFRESCFRHSGDHERKNNPSYYRHPEFYNKVFKDCHLLDDSGNSCEFSLVNFKCIGAYVKIRKDHNQICWMWQKVCSGDDRGFLKFFDKDNKILQHELVFGKGFLSSGGIETTKEFVDKLDLQPGQNVLDVGCGTGGADFYMAEKYNVRVVGIDLSVDVISFALERAVGRTCVVEFEAADCTKKEYPSNTFDVIYSCDTILHIQDKPALFSSFYKWIKPGGIILISCYCKKDGSPPSEDFAKYIIQEGYDVHDLEAYEQMLRDAGFDEVISEDRTEQFLSNLEKEMDNFEKNKETFIKDFSEEDYNDIVGGLKSKLKWGGGSVSGSGSSLSGELKWGLFLAKKKKK